MRPLSKFKKICIARITSEKGSFLRDGGDSSQAATAQITPTANVSPGKRNSHKMYRAATLAALMILLGFDLPVVGARLRGLWFGKSRRGELCHHFVDMTAAVTDHKPDIQNTAGSTGRHMRHV